MLHQINSSTLAALDKEEQLQELGALVNSAKSANGKTTTYLKNRIRKFELRYEMSSAKMLEALRSGEQKETADIAKWLFLLNALEDKMQAAD